MEKLQTKNHYRDVLIHELQARTQRNASYSLRSFARDLGLAPSGLSRILTGQQGLSPMKAKQIAKKLELSDLESDYFCSLIEAEHSRSQKMREFAKNKLQSQEISATELSIDYFKTISDWHYFAIVELTQVKGFQSNPTWIAEQLGISVDTAKESLKRLLKLELIEETKAGLQKTTDFRTTTTGIPSRAIKSYHQQILKKAETALIDQDVSEREFAAVTFAMDQDDLAWAKSEMQKFRRELTSRLAKREEKNRLYQFSMQLFALSNVKNKTIKESKEK